jgi:hypothetical protein
MCCMKIRIHRPRSCLGWFFWPLGILLSLVLLHNLYAWAEIFGAQAAAYELAGELGYTPDDFLSSRVYGWNVNIVTGSAECTAEYVFVTPLDWPDFEARLRAAQPGRWIGMNGRVDYSIEVYYDLPLYVNGVSGSHDAWMTFPRMPFMSWFLAQEQLLSVSWYQPAQVPARITFGDRPIDGNIAVIHRSAGRYPIWVWC